jgi:hypothetical protein
MPAFSANARHAEQSAAARSAEPEVPRCDRCGRADRALTTDPTRARVAGHCARCSWVLLSAEQLSSDALDESPSPRNSL